MHRVLEPETDRLRLRQWRDNDREPFARMNADPRVMEFFPTVLSRADSDALMDRCQSLITEQGWGLWAVEKRDNDEFIGFVGLNRPAYDLPFSPCVEIGWRLGFEHWGKGYATEAAQSALRTGFEQLGFPEIVSYTPVNNKRSRAVMERLHMRDTGETFQHPMVQPGSPLRLHCLYRLTFEQWQ
ncbi:MAG: GNAT family N-acetyltransferase [Acidiferrobacterales bacterium]